LNRENYCLDYIREVVGDKKVLVCPFNIDRENINIQNVLFKVMVSGGVDSTVCAALLRQALGPERVIAVHIDNGFMRHNESNLVEKALNALGLNVHSESFLAHCFFIEFFK
jgi:GMP synthase (glutamine-hydrolysing)